jgi:hypothetical protein
MSALPLKADIRQRIAHVCFVPKADLPGRRDPFSCDFRSRNGQYRGLRAEVTVFIGTVVAQLSLAE